VPHFNALAPDSAGELTALPQARGALAGFKGPTSKGRKDMKEGQWRGEKKGK